MSSSSWIVAVGCVIAGALVVAAFLPQESGYVPVTAEAAEPIHTVAAVIPPSGHDVVPTQPRTPDLSPPPPQPEPEPQLESESDRIARVEAVRTQVSSEFDRRRVETARRCFPSGLDGLQGGQVSLQIVVDAEGREIARGFSESRELGTDLSGCLREALAAPVRVAAPGKITDVEFPFP